MEGWLSRSVLWEDRECDGLLTLVETAPGLWQYASVAIVCFGVENDVSLPGADSWVVTCAR